MCRIGPGMYHGIEGSRCPVSVELPRPALGGRFVRFATGVTLAGALLLTLPDELRDPDGLFWFLLLVAYVSLPRAARLLPGALPGRIARLVALLVAAALALGGAAFGPSFWYPVLAWYSYVLLLAVLVPQVAAFVLAGLLGTPGCEWRSFAHLAARLRGAPPPRFEPCSLRLEAIDRLERRLRGADRET